MSIHKHFIVALCLAGGLAAQGFEDVTTFAGVGGPQFVNPTDGDWRVMAAGIAVFDFNNDTWDDVFWAGGSLQASRLYRNDMEGTFTDVAATAGVDVTAPITMTAFADYDADGDLDLFLQTYEDYSYDGGPVEHRNFLFRNNGDETFTDVTLASGLKESGRWGASFGDLDGDTDLDLVTVSWLASDPTQFWRNEGDGTFADVTPAAISSDLINGFAPAIIDYDGDGDQDVLSANDFQTSRVWRNDGPWQFTKVNETIVDGGDLDDDNGMGSTFGDFNNDGAMDWFVSSIYAENPPAEWTIKTGNRLYIGNGDGTFTDGTDFAGVRDGAWGWGSEFTDLDNNGHVDLVHVNGFPLPAFPEMSFLEDTPPRVFMNDGAGFCTDSSAFLGIVDPGQGKGCVTFDYDHDGLVDVLIANYLGGLTLYRNKKLDKQSFIWVALSGRDDNTHGIGAKIEFTHPSLEPQTAWIHHGDNYASMSPPLAWFGGAGVTSGRLRVRWPSGTVSTHPAKMNRRVTLFEPLPGQGLTPRDRGAVITGTPPGF